MPSTTSSAWEAAEAAGLTVTTALNTARLEMLGLQCQSWPGHLTAALYVPLLMLPGEEHSAQHALEPEHEEQLRSAHTAAASLIDR
jgi:hypothetical protein